MQTRNWEAQDGTKRYKTEIVGENMIMLDGNASGENGGASSYSQEATNSSPAVRKTSPKQEEEISIEDIPF
jgi:single-strand DNA-binding protein